MLKNSKKLLAMLMAIIMCLTAPLATLAEAEPTNEPAPATVEPTEAPSEPTKEPVEPTEAPTKEPIEPTEVPTEEPVEPTEAPTEEPAEPTEVPTEEPTEEPAEPTEAPTEEPAEPTEVPTEEPAEPTASVEPIAEEVVALDSKAAPAQITLPLGSTTKLGLSTGDTQYCAVTLSSAGYFNLNATHTSGSGKATVRVTSKAAGTTYLSGTISSSNPTLQLGNWFSAGDYWVTVELEGSGTSYPGVNYTLTPTLDATSAVSGNGDIDNARTLSVSDTYTNGLLSCNNNQSWWKITLAAPGRLEVGIRSYVDKVNAYVLQLRDAQRTRKYIDMSVTGGTATTPKFNTAGDWLEAGTYYLCVNGFDSYTGIYGVSATFTAANNVEGSDNNNYLSATSLTVNGSAIRCLLSQTDDMDVYSFTLTERATVVINAQAYMNALNMRLYDGNMRSLLADGSASGTAGTINKPYLHQISKTLDAGTYTVQVSRDPEGPCGIYTMAVATDITIASISLNATVFSVGQQVTATANITGKAATSYTFRLQKQNATTGVYADYTAEMGTTANSYSFTTAAGVYRVKVMACDGYKWVTEYSAPFTVKTASQITITSINADKEEVNAGEEITFTGTAGGGNALQQMIFAIYDQNNTQVASVVTTNGIGTYRPTTVGTYTVMAVATDGSQWTSAWGPTFTVNPPLTLTISKITTNPVSQMNVNSQMNVTVETENGKPIQWIYEVYFNDNFLTRYYTTSDKFVYTPNTTGKYRLMVVVTDGTYWTSAWGDNIYVQPSAALSIAEVKPSKTAVEINGTVDFTMSYSGGSTVQFTKYELYNVAANTKVDEWAGNENTHTFAFSTAGTYRVMGVAFDGTTWTSKFSKNITVAAPAPIVMSTVEANTTNASVGETVVFTTKISSGKPTQYYYEIYNVANNALVHSSTSTSKKMSYSFATPGTYRVMGVTTDGYNWTSVWGSQVTVTGVNQLGIENVRVVDGTSKTYPESFTVTPAFTKGQEIIAIYYEVYDYSTGKQLTAGSGKNGSFTFTPVDKTIEKYRVMVVATDGYDWVSKFSDVITYKMPGTMTCTKISNNAKNGSIELGQSISFQAEITGGAPLVSTTVSIYRKVNGVQSLVDRQSGNSKVVTFTPNARGDYRVMMTLYDGITWITLYSDYVSVVE